MRFTEINLFGVYVAPISVMLVAAWVVTIGLRRFAARFGCDPVPWHLPLMNIDTEVEPPIWYMRTFWPSLVSLERDAGRRHLAAIGRPSASDTA